MESERIARMNAVVAMSAADREERRAQCAILGHETAGWYLTANPIHVCVHCLMRYQIGDGFGWDEV